MECQTCIDIVTAAFESAVLSDRTNENAIRKGQQQVKSEIERLYREYERKAYLDTYTQEISIEALRLPCSIWSPQSHKYCLIIWPPVKA